MRTRGLLGIIDNARGKKEMTAPLTSRNVEVERQLPSDAPGDEALLTKTDASLKVQAPHAAANQNSADQRAGYRRMARP